MKRAAYCRTTVGWFASFIMLFVLMGLGNCSKSESSTNTASAGKPFSGVTIEAFVGTASKPPTELAAAEFEALTGATVELHFGGSGKVLTEMKLTERGDVYFPGSSDYMEKAKREGLVDATTEQRVVYLIPAINVMIGSGKKVESLADLAQPGLRVGLGRPDTVCVGLYGVEVLENAKLSAAVRPNIINYTESCEKTATLLSLGAVDAVLGWDVFEHWDPEHIKTVYLPKEQVPRIGYIPVAVAKFTKHPKVAQAFIDFLMSPQGRAIFKKWQYLTSEQEARAFTLPTTPVGGEWTLPSSWQ
jgi:molybdate transport system substrate-binding protein